MDKYEAEQFLEEHGWCLIHRTNDKDYNGCSLYFCKLCIEEKELAHQRKVNEAKKALGWKK